MDDVDIKDETQTEDQSESFQENKFLTFTVGEEEYGIEIQDVIEIIGIQNITFLPNVPPYVKGVINLRGKVIPVMDVRLRFGLEERPYDERTCIIVVNVQDLLLGLIVDFVREVCEIPAENIEPPATIGPGKGSEAVRGFAKVGDEVKILLDTRKLFFHEDMETICRSTQTESAE